MGQIQIVQRRPTKGCTIGLSQNQVRRVRLISEPRQPEGRFRLQNRLARRLTAARIRAGTLTLAASAVAQRRRMSIDLFPEITVREMAVMLLDHPRIGMAEILRERDQRHAGLHGEARIGVA